jgi:hypothetical protein
MFRNFKDVTNFTFLSINNIINSSFGTFILIIFVLSGDLINAANLGVLAALTILLTKIFSLNLRNIYLAKKKHTELENHIILRFFISIVISLISFFFLYYFINSKNINLYILILIFVSQWLLELVLVKLELNRDKMKIFCLLTINFIMILSSIFLVLISKDIVFFKYLLLLYLVTLLIIFFTSIEKKNFNFNKNFFYKIFSTFKTSIASYSFLSSISLNLANLLWRILLIFFVGKNLSSIIFLFYSLGSFPGTIFNASFGPNIVKKKISHWYILLFVIFYIALVSPILFILNNNFIYFNLERLLLEISFKNIVLFSFFGSIIMTYALYFRQKSINIFPNLKNFVFIKDIYVSVLLVLLIPVLNFTGGVSNFAYSYFFSSIVSFILYLDYKQK